MVKKRKPLLFWLYDLIVSGLDKKKTPEDLVRQHVADVRMKFRTELAGELAAVLFAKKTLDTTRYIETPFPDTYLLGETQIDAAAAPALMAYAQALATFQAELQERGTPISFAAARGMTTWIVTFYAMSLPGLLPEARALWAKLADGADGLEDAHKFLLRRAPSDIERTYFDYRPTALL